MVDLNCYIDEAGDEGIDTGGSRWFVLGAVVVPAEDDLRSSAAVPEIKRRLGKDETRFVLHWRKMRDHTVKKFVSHTLGNLPFTLSVVAVDKEDSQIKQSGLKSKDALYRYAARYLIERLSWLAHDSGRIARITFEHRSSLDYDGLKSYWEHLRTLTPATSIRWHAVDWIDISIRPKGRCRWLQIADSCCGAVFSALEADRFGNVEDDYVMALKDRFYRRGDNLFSYGLKFMPTTALHRAKEEFGWLTKI